MDNGDASLREALLDERRGFAPLIANARGEPERSRTATRFAEADSLGAGGNLDDAVFGKDAACIPGSAKTKRADHHIGTGADKLVRCRNRVLRIAAVVDGNDFEGPSGKSATGVHGVNGKARGRFDLAAKGFERARKGCRHADDNRFGRIQSSRDGQSGDPRQDRCNPCPIAVPVLFVRAHLLLFAIDCRYWVLSVFRTIISQTTGSIAKSAVSDITFEAG